MTKVAAVAGTAKLKSAIVSSFMNAKKETAIMATATMTYQFRDSAAATRPRAPGRKSWISP